MGEPVVNTINFAKKIGYENIVMAGLSGGGWTTTLMAAIDPRIGLSFPVAGSMPCDFAHTSWDYEQFCNHPHMKIANYSSMYVLAALEPQRNSVQIIHDKDSCCFHGCGRHSRVRAYNEWVHGELRSNNGGKFATAITSGNVHEVNPRDKVIISYMIDKWLNVGLEDADFEIIPYNTLSKW